MFIELHMLQSFAPSCLNRDDTNAPKDCVFGGTRRARISSQCIKRAIRETARASGALEGEMGTRTKRLQETLVKQAVARGKDAGEAAMVSEYTVNAIGFKVKKKEGKITGLTEYLLFLGASEIEALAEVMEKHWDMLLDHARIAYNNEKKTKESGENKQKEGIKKSELPIELGDALKSIHGGRAATDVALFGRMLANLPERNVDAACQVAHAISTHKAEMESDFFTALDDLRADDTSGAEMMGTVEFNSACFYRYAVIHWEKLAENLGGDKDLARRALVAFVRGAIEAIPTGKQNTFAAHNLPGLVFAVVRKEGAPWSLANAFEKPVCADGEGILRKSGRAMARYWESMTWMYGIEEGATRVYCALEDDHLLEPLGEKTASVEQLLQVVAATLSGSTE